MAIVNPLPGTIRLATPLIFGALAGCPVRARRRHQHRHRGPVPDGRLLRLGGLAAWSTARRSGLVGGILAGVAMAALLAVFALRYQVNQVVLGVVLIALAAGLTSFLLSQIPDDPEIKKYLNEPPILQRIPIPGLADIPVIGPGLFNQTLLVYLMYVSVVFVTLVLFETKWGLRVRVGRRAPQGRRHGRHQRQPDPLAGGAARRRVRRARRGVLHRRLHRLLRRGRLRRQRLHRAGRRDHGPLAPGRGHAGGAVLRLLWTLQAQLAFLDKIPGELLRAAPYLATIIAVAGFVGRVRPPAADGEPYVKS